MKNPWLKRKEDKEEAIFSSMMQQVCIDVKDDYIMGVDMMTTISNTPGYPSDDMNSLCQYSSGDCCLDIFYNSQYVSNEVLDVMNKHSGFTSYIVSHTPVLPGTVAGLITFDENNKYSFTICLDGTFSYHRIGLYSSVNFIPFSAASSLDVDTGVLNLEWCGNISPEVKISYEYNIG